MVLKSNPYRNHKGICIGIWSFPIVFSLIFDSKYTRTCQKPSTAPGNHFKVIVEWSEPHRSDVQDQISDFVAILCSQDSYLFALSTTRSHTWSIVLWGVKSQKSTLSNPNSTVKALSNRQENSGNRKMNLFYIETVLKTLIFWKKSTKKKRKF